ncbi:MAG: hypothetical protein ACI9YU_000917 [Flavobacteriales bacterium]
MLISIALMAEICIDGDCECPNGFSGTHCEDEEGYDCNSGSCQFVYGNPEYSSLTECETGCGGVSGDSGYNCSGGNCSYVSSGASYSSLSACESACGPSGTGQVVIYSTVQFPCPAGAGNTVSVSIDGSYVGSLSQYWPSGSPDCGGTSAITRTLSVGTHTVYAECGTNYWPTSTFTITQGGCQPFSLN